MLCHSKQTHTGENLEFFNRLPGHTICLPIVCFNFKFFLTEAKCSVRSLCNTDVNFTYSNHLINQYSAYWTMGFKKPRSMSGHFVESVCKLNSDEIRK